jgi:serine/threonine protein kinase
MIQKIGKYRIIERIGRGGMGSVYKAHDPILDRLVALKVVSAETDHTDELRARFFREAQACAKLSHPNVVTIHDLGEADGNLFIVMELLEGDELRQLIARRAITHLEDKLPLMIQICEGLEYAHEKGIVHRDVKPGNIFVLRNGQVKILDFGIAQIAAAETGLTRAGLIVGTLQYMAPERARGQGGQSSDIFSVGAVFYEFLTNRAPFSGEDPIEILDKLRTENPPRLSEVDPGVPLELCAIIERALAKDPTQRFANLGQMRSELTALRRKRAEDTERLRQDVQGRLRQLHELRGALESRLGGPWADETVFVVDEHAPLTTLESVGRDTSTRIARLTELLARAEMLKPALDSGLEALRAGDFDRAVVELDRVVDEMPEHAQAVESLRLAQHQIAERRQGKEQLEAFVREASAAYEAREYARCLEILDWVAQHSAGEPAPADAERVRTAAQAALASEQEAEAARQDERRRANESAMRMRERAEHARRAAETAEARLDQTHLWGLAETKLADGRAAIAEEAYGPAEQHLDEARQLFERAEAAARQARAAARAAQLAEARRVDTPTETVRPNRTVDDTVFSEADAPTVMVQTPPVAFPPPAKWPTPTSSVPVEAKVAPVEAKAAPAAAKPIAFESPRVEPIATRAAARTRPVWQSPRYLGPAAAGVLLLAGIGIYYAASTPARKEARDSARVAAVEQQKAQVDQLRAGVVVAAERATKAEAGALAVAVLSRAQAAQAEGERLAAAGEFKAATQAYQEASERFGEAERTAQTKREQRTAADVARAQMVAAKQRASSAAPDYARALEGERQAGSLYAQTSFPEATAGFRAAADLFAKALPPEPPKPASVAPAPSAPATPSAAATPTPSAAPSAPTPSTAPATPSAPAAGAANPRAEIRGVLDTYVRAIETKNLASLQQVRPGLTADEINRMRVANEIKKSHKVDLKVDEITVNGDEARATGRREDDINLKEGQRIRQDSKFTYTLKHGPRGWFIQEAREEAVKAPRGTAADSTSRGGRKP